MRCLRTQDSGVSGEEPDWKKGGVYDHLAVVIVGNKLSVEKLHFNVAELFHLRNSSSIQSKNSLQIWLHHKLCDYLLMNPKKEYDEVSA